MGLMMYFCASVNKVTVVQDICLAKFKRQKLNDVLNS